MRELNESFTVTLSNPSANAAIGRASATVGIVDDDTIEVSGSGDIVAGTAGADYFVISAGDHTVSGLGGTDRFVFAAPGGTTVLADFDFAAGERIDLRPIDAIAGTLANDAFTFVGAAGFTPAAGELLGIQIDPGVQLVAGDTDGDGTADFNIIIVSNDPAQANWFLL